MAKMKDLTGQKFGRLTAIELSGRDKYGYCMWVCRCDCGKITNPIKSSLLKRGKTKSCGCIGRVDILEFRKKSGFIQSTNLSIMEKGNIYKTNTTGVRGVSFEGRKNKYRAIIQFKGKRVELGYFSTIEEAAQARKKAEDEIRDELKRLRDIFDKQEV